MTPTRPIQARPANSNGRAGDRVTTHAIAPIHSGHSGSVAASLRAASAGTASVAGWPGFGIRAREPERSTSPEPSSSGTNQSAGIAAAQATSSARSSGRRRHSISPKASRNGHASTRSSAQRDAAGERRPRAVGPPGLDAREREGDRPARLGARGAVADQVAAEGDARGGGHPGRRPAEVAAEPEGQDHREHHPGAGDDHPRLGRRLPERSEQRADRDGQRLERRHLLGAQRAVRDLAAPEQPRPRVVGGRGRDDQRRQRRDGERGRR